MRRMTLDQIDLVGNGFHQAPDAFIKSHTMEPKAWTQQKKKKLSHDNTPVGNIAELYIFHPNPGIFTSSTNTKEQPQT